MGMRLFLDACTIIYLIESQEQLGQKTRLLLTQALQNKAQLIVSKLTPAKKRALGLSWHDTIKDKTA